MKYETGAHKTPPNPPQIARQDQDENEYDNDDDDERTIIGWLMVHIDHQIEQLRSSGGVHRSKFSITKSWGAVEQDSNYGAKRLKINSTCTLLETERT